MGFISGILHNELAENWQGALRAAAGYGFRELEISNYLGDSREDFLAFLKDIDLTITAGGVGFTEDMDEVEQAFDRLQAIGASHAVCYYPWLSGGPFTLDECKQSAEIMNEAGRRAKARGLTYCWHNHDKEFATMAWGLPYDYLMQHTDPELVHAEMDVYWIAKGGADPVTMLQKYEGRFRLMHIKDMAAGAEQAIACPGDGILDFPGIFAECERQGIVHFQVEKDRAIDGLGCLKISAEFLFGLNW